MNAVDTLALVGTIVAGEWDDACFEATVVEARPCRDWQDEIDDEAMVYDCRFEFAVVAMDIVLDEVSSLVSIGGDA